MLSADQKLLLANLIFSNKTTLMGKLLPGVTNKIRSAAWDEVTQELISNGASPTLTTSYVRHTEWGNLQKSVMEKFKKHQKSGAEGMEQ